MEKAIVFYYVQYAQFYLANLQIYKVKRIWTDAENGISLIKEVEWLP